MTFDHARQYLARVVPWPQDGEAPFYVNVHWKAQAPDKDRPFWSGRATRSVTEAVRAVEWALKLPETQDVYLCLSAQKTAQSRTSAKGHNYLLPIRSQENVVGLKALFLDIDIKAGSGYPDVTSAVAGLKEFITKIALPAPTMVVSSGGGLHVYWVLERALTRTEWQPLADALAEATRQTGLKADTVCTVDSARILRVPDTFNRKKEPPRPVRLAGKVLDFDYSVERIQQALAPYITKAPLPQRTPVASNDLAAGIETKAPPVDLDAVAGECKLIKEAITSGGKDFANPLWNLTTLASVFTVGGRADAHRMADKHPGYTQESTDELFDRKMREKDSKNFGWPSCQAFENAGSSHCAGCPHKVAGKSPLNFQTKPVTTPPPDLPAGYVRDGRGVVCRVSVDDTGKNVLIPLMDYPATHPWLQRDPWVLNFSTITHTGHKAQVALPLLACSTKEGIPKELSKQGLVLHEHQLKGAREFFVSWITTLQKSKQAIVSAAPFGWNYKGGEPEGFVFGGHVWMPNDSRPAAPADPIAASMHMPTGSLQPWLDMSELITSQGRPALNAILASAFAAPMVRILGLEGLLMSAYSQESGIGKTTAMRTAQAVWGDPIKAMQGLSDTEYSVVRKIGELRSLPIYWDELKSEEQTQKFVRLTFQLTSGRERSRLHADTSMRNMGTWHTMLISASNESLVDQIAAKTKQTTAGIYRIFEFSVTPGSTGQIDQSDAQRMLAKLYDNYGVVGLEYAKFLGSNYKQIEVDLIDFQKQLATRLNAQNDERYWRGTVAAICMGARYANKLGFTKIDEEQLLEFMIASFEAMRDYRRGTHVDMKSSLNLSNVLTQFLNAMRTRHTLFTNRIHISRGKPAAGSITIKGDTSKLDGLYVHVGLDDKLLRISSFHLTGWLTEHGYSRHMFTKALEKEWGVREVVGRLGSGTQYAQGTEYILQIDLAGTPLANFIEEP